MNDQYMTPLELVENSVPFEMRTEVHSEIIYLLQSCDLNFANSYSEALPSNLYPNVSSAISSDTDSDQQSRNNYISPTENMKRSIGNVPAISAQTTRPENDLISKYKNAAAAALASRKSSLSTPVHISRRNTTAAYDYEETLSLNTEKSSCSSFGETSRNVSHGDSFARHSLVSLQEAPPPWSDLRVDTSIGKSVVSNDKDNKAIRMDSTTVVNSATHVSSRSLVQKITKESEYSERDDSEVDEEEEINEEPNQFDVMASVSDTIWSFTDVLLGMTLDMFKDSTSKLDNVNPAVISKRDVNLPSKLPASSGNVVSTKVSTKTSTPANNNNQKGSFAYWPFSWSSKDVRNSKAKDAGSLASSSSDVNNAWVTRDAPPTDGELFQLGLGFHPAKPPAFISDELYAQVEAIKVGITPRRHIAPPVDVQLVVNHMKAEADRIRNTPRGQIISNDSPYILSTDKDQQLHSEYVQNQYEQISKQNPFLMTPIPFAQTHDINNKSLPKPLELPSPPIQSFASSDSIHSNMSNYSQSANNVTHVNAYSVGKSLPTGVSWRYVDVFSNPDLLNDRS